MWDRKKSDIPQAAAPSTPAWQPQQQQPLPEAQLAPPTRSPEPVRVGATIGKAVRIIGDVYSGEDLYIDGEVQGLLEVKGSKVTIGPNGKAKSDVHAREVVIQGQVQGNVEATQKITIRKDGSLVGNIKTTGIVIEDDAYFKGSIDIVRNSDTARA
ncbi:MAG: polymer-forming cytoskeletal protein [Bryobacteraceae bacterium]|nr:polymer-forming cytoskeletal protein [Bryobacteraceae bacterium]